MRTTFWRACLVFALLTGLIAAQPARADDLIIPAGLTTTQLIGNNSVGANGAMVTCDENYPFTGDRMDHLRTTPMYLVGAFMSDGAWLDMLSTQCADVDPDGKWSHGQARSAYWAALDSKGYEVDIPGITKYRLLAGTDETETVMANTELTYTVALPGGSPDTMTCPRNYYVDGIGGVLAAEKNAVARLSLDCLNPTTGQRYFLSPRAAEAGTGLTFSPAPQPPGSFYECPKGMLGVGYDALLPLKSDGTYDNYIESVGLVCEPYKPNPLAMRLLGPADHLAEIMASIPSQLIGTFAASPAPVPQPIWLYTETQNGDLYWWSLPGGETQWLGPAKVGNGWQAFQDIIPGAGDQIYARAADGYLYSYVHNGFQSGTFDWAPSVRLGSGWQEIKTVFGGGDGLLYVLQNSGELFWYNPSRVAGQDNFFAGAHQIDTGWTDVTTAFAMGHGIIYAVKPGGNLFWYDHLGYQNGSASWADSSAKGRLIGSGWDKFKKIMPVGDGLILAIDANNDVWRLQHLDYLTGGKHWTPAVKVGHVDDFKDAFALMPSAPSGNSVSVR